MADLNVVVDDDFFTNAGLKLKERAAFADKVFSRYLTELNGVLETGLMEGETAKALREFVECLEPLKGQVETEGNSLYLSTKVLLEEVDDLDEDLYEE